MRMNTSIEKYPLRARTAGFTLIEMAICILITGFLFIPLINLYTTSQFSKKLELTTDSISSMTSEITGFQARRGRFPCPANRTLNPGDVNYGLESNIATVPACSGAMQGICFISSSRDTDVDVDTVADPVIIGGVPVVAIRNAGGVFTDQSALDGWGNRLTYAVSARLCPGTKTRDSRDFRWGVIRAVDEFGNPTAGIGVTDVSIPPDTINDADGQFVVLSHGLTGDGAYSANGTIVAPCDAAGTNPLDEENCDNDATFISALGQYKGAGAGFFDDVVRFYLYKPSTLWDNMSTLVGGVPNRTANIQNLNSNSVGVLTDAPQVKLEVAGNARVESVKTPRYCNQDGTRCFDYDWFGPSALTGVTPLITQKLSTNTLALPVAKANVCQGGEVIKSIGWDATVLPSGAPTITCGRPALSPPPAAIKCSDIDPTKPYLRGIKSNGDLICN